MVEAPSFTGGQEERVPGTEFSQALLQAIGDAGVAVLDAGGRIQFWSKSAERLEGYTGSSLQGEPFARGFAPEEREAQVFERWIEEAARTGVFRGRARRVRRDGSCYWADVTLSRSQGEFVAVLRDETDEYARWRNLMDENRLLHFMLRSAPADFWAVTADGEATGQLPSRWLGGVLDASWYGAGQGIRNEDRAAVMAARRDALLQRRPYQVEYRTSEDAARWLREEGVPRPGENGRLWGVCGSLQDVTRWRKEDASSSEFVGQLTQEVRRAATTILHAVEVAQESTPPGERMALTEGIEQAARELLARVDNVAELGRKTPKKRRGLVRFDPTALIRDMWEAAGTAAAGRGITLEALLHDALPDRVQGDATALRQLLRVLLNHAVQAAWEKAVLELRCAEQGGVHLLRIEVKFEGAPLPEGLREWLLSPAGDAGLNFGQEGVDLGLAKRVADELEAGLSIEVERGETCFRCAVELLPAAASAYRAATEISLAGRSVLAVTPDRTLRKVLQLRFAALGMRAMTAESGEEAWRLMEEAPAGTFDLVIAQYQGPGLSGNALARRLSGHPAWRELPLATVSMVGEPGQAAAAQEAGFSAYLTPPLPVELLRDVLQALLAREAGGELITRFTIAEQRSLV